MVRNAKALIWGLGLAFLGVGCSDSTGAMRTGGTTGVGATPSGDASNSASSGGGGSSASNPEGGGNSGSSSGGSSGSSSGSTTDPSSGGEGGSAGSDAGGSTAGGADGGGSSEAGPAVACPNGSVFCDDFESYAAMTAPNVKWKTWTVGAGTLVVDSAHAFSGKKAAHIHGTVSQSGASKEQAFMLAQGAPAFPVAGNTIFVRFMLFGTRFPFTGATAVNHISLAWIGSSSALSTPDRSAENQGYTLSDYNGIAMERLSSGYFRDTTKHFKDPSQANTWHCWEMEIDNAGGPPPGGVGSALPHAWEDGVELKLALAGDKTVPYMAVPFEALLFSLWSPQSDTSAADYWIDDVAVSKSRIQCPAP